MAESDAKRRKTSKALPKEPTLRSIDGNGIQFRHGFLPEEICVHIFSYVFEDMQWPVANVCTLLRLIKERYNKIHYRIHNLGRALITHLYKLEDSPVNTGNTAFICLYLKFKNAKPRPEFTYNYMFPILRRFPRLIALTLVIGDVYKPVPIHDRLYPVLAQYKRIDILYPNVIAPRKISRFYYRHIPSVLGELFKLYGPIVKRSKSTWIRIFWGVTVCSRCSDRMALSIGGWLFITRSFVEETDTVANGIRIRVPDELFGCYKRKSTIYDCVGCNMSMCVNCSRDAYRRLPLPPLEDYLDPKYVLCDNCAATHACLTCALGIMGKQCELCNCWKKCMPVKKVRKTSEVQLKTRPMTVDEWNVDIYNFVKANKDNALVQYMYKHHCAKKCAAEARSTT